MHEIPATDVPPPVRSAVAHALRVAAGSMGPAIFPPDEPPEGWVHWKVYDERDHPEARHVGGWVPSGPPYCISIVWWADGRPPVRYAWLAAHEAWHHFRRLTGAPYGGRAEQAEADAWANRYVRRHWTRRCPVG